MALKVLVVEDDAPTLELMDEVLTSLKVEVHAVSDSEQAATLVNQKRFDGIFVDLQMPKVDGFELARRIRASSWNKSTPIVVVTGHDDTKTMQKAFAAGTTFFLQKPIDRQRLTNLFKARSRKDVREPPPIRARSASNRGDLPSWRSNFPRGEFKYQSGRNTIRGGTFPVTGHCRPAVVPPSRPGVKNRGDRSCGPGR